MNKNILALVTVFVTSSVNAFPNTFTPFAWISEWRQKQDDVWCRDNFVFASTKYIEDNKDLAIAITPANPSILSPEMRIKMLEAHSEKKLVLKRALGRPSIFASRFVWYMYNHPETDPKIFYSRT